MSASTAISSSSSKHAPFRRRGSILLTLVAVLTAVGLVPLAFVSWKLISYNREALITEQQVYQLLLATSIAREVDSHVDGLQSQFMRVVQAMGPALARTGPEGQDEVRRLLDDVTDDRMVCVRYSGLRGESVASGSAPVDPGALEPMFALGFRRAAESLAGGSDDRSGTVWTSDPILLSGRAALLLSSPVVSGGKFRGVLSAVVDVQSAWDAVAADKSIGHTILAVDSTGVVFASNDPRRIARGQTVTQSDLVVRFRAADSRDPATIQFTEEERGKRQEYLGSYLKTRRGWGVLVQTEKERIFAPVHRMVQTTGKWLIAALGLALVAAIALAGTLSNPIQRLAAASREFASGNLAARVQVRSRNEIGELAETFNLMASEIEDYIRQLEQAAKENRELFLGTINALTAAIDAKDPYTRGHSERVNAYAVTLARTMGLPKEQIWEIDVASRLHDVGKIAIDDAVLRKPGRLTPVEMEQMKTHPVRGAAIMEPIHQMKNMIPGLRSHHERWEGGGYPDGLEGKDIPLMARIIAVADTFDATTTHRPYQQAMTYDQARDRINQLKGSGLDAQVVEAFNRAYEAGSFHLEPKEETAGTTT